MEGLVWIKQLIKRGKKGTNELPHPRVSPVYRLCREELNQGLFCWQSCVAGRDGKQCSSARCQGNDREGCEWGLWSPAAVWANTGHWALLEWWGGGCPGKRHIFTQTKKCVFRGISQTVPWAYSEKHAERKYIYFVFGLGFCLFITPLEMRSLGFRADPETSEANLKTDLDQKFMLESLSAWTLLCIAFCKDKITRPIMCLAGKHHVHHVAFKTDCVCYLCPLYNRKNR